MSKLYDDISPRFPTLAVLEDETRCLEKAPPWNASCPCSSWLDLAEIRLSDPHRAIDAIEHAAKMMLGDQNNDPKMLTYPRIEYYLWQIAKRIMIPSPKIPQPKKVKKILHVATELFHTGGHTKVLSSFVHSDKSDREHWFFRRGLPCNSPLHCSRNIALVEKLLPIPSEHIHHCHPEGEGFDFCANYLRNMSSWFDLVWHTFYSFLPLIFIHSFIPLPLIFIHSFIPLPLIFIHSFIPLPLIFIHLDRSSFMYTNSTRYLS